MKLCVNGLRRLEKSEGNPVNWFRNPAGWQAAERTPEVAALNLRGRRKA